MTLLNTRETVAFVAVLFMLLPASSTARPALPGVPGDPDAGRAVFLDRERGHCLLCHQVTTLTAPFQGNIGPDLTSVGARLSAETLRARIVDPTRFNPETAMPAYHRTTDLRQVAPEFEGKPILTAQEVDDLVAFLVTLQTPSREAFPEPAAGDGMLPAPEAT